MRRRPILHAILVVVLLSTAGCMGTRLTLDDSGQTISLTPGQPLTVLLESNPTTGFGWTMAAIDEAVLANTANRYVANPTSGNVTGGGGMDIWNFIAQAVGQSTLRLEYRRPFDPPDVAPDRVFEATIVVQPV